MNIHQTVPRSDCTSFAKCGKHSLAYCRRYGASECGPCEIVRRKPRNWVVVDGVERKLCTRCGRALPLSRFFDRTARRNIRKYGLPYSKYYDAPYSLNRHGCVGCSLCSYKQMQLEFKMFPGYARRIIVAIGKYMNTHLNGFLARNFTDGYEAFYYYINEIPIADFHEQKRGLFGFNAKEVIEREMLNQKGNKI